jgi:hypothetical protein
MGIFDNLSRQPQQASPQHQMDPRQMQAQMRQEIGRISAHPSDYLKQYGYTIPDGMTDAKEITQHLLQSGQIGTPRLQQVVSMLGRR